MKHSVKRQRDGEDQSAVRCVAYDRPLHRESDLLVGEAQLLRPPHHLGRHGALVLIIRLQDLLVIDDVLHLVQEPAVDLGQLVQVIYTVVGVEGGGQHEDTLVRGNLELLISQSIYIYINISFEFKTSLSSTTLYTIIIIIKIVIKTATKRYNNL